MKSLTLRFLRAAVQLHWYAFPYERSITLFLFPSHVREMRRAARYMNDVKWFGPVRYSSTY